MIPIRLLLPDITTLLLAYLLSLAAIVLFGFQSISTFRLADFLTPMNAVSLLAGAGVAFVVAFICVEYFNVLTETSLFLSFGVSVVISAILFFVVTSNRTFSVIYLTAAIICLAGI